MQNVALGGLAYGLLAKNWPGMPTVPGIGRSGTVALAVYFLKPTSKLLQDVGVAAAAIAGFSFGEKGTVSGGYDPDDVLSEQA
jgi:ABC-type Mn2+/Zn2+ transport system permease subunit